MGVAVDLVLADVVVGLAVDLVPVARFFLFLNTAIFLCPCDRIGTDTQNQLAVPGSIS